MKSENPKPEIDLLAKVISYFSFSPSDGEKAGARGTIGLPLSKFELLSPESPAVHE